MNLKPGTKISEYLSQSVCTQTAITKDGTIKERFCAREFLVHSHRHYDKWWKKTKVEQPDTKRHNTEGCKFSKLLELNFVLNFIHICRFSSFFVNFLRPSDVYVLKVYCNRGTSSCFHDAPREMKFLTFHRRITSDLFSTSTHFLFLSLSVSLSHTHTHTHTHTRLDPQGANQWHQCC